VLQGHVGLRRARVRSRAIVLNQAGGGGGEDGEEADEAQTRQAEAFFQAPGLTTRDIASMTVPQLKDQLRERGLKVGGNKGEVLQRLQDAIDGKIASPGPVSTSLSRGPATAGTRRSASSSRASPATTKAAKTTGGGIKLAEGERLPVASALPKRALDDSMTRIFVKGIPFRASPRDLAFTLEDAFGPITKLEGMTLDGRGTGRAWVTFENSEIAKAAVEEARIEMDNRPIFFSPPWSLAARQALREMADMASYESDMTAPAYAAPAERGADRYGMSRDDRQITTDYVPASTTMEEIDIDDNSPGGRTLFVGRVPLDATEDDISEGLAEMGQVEKCFMGRVNQKNPDSDFAGFAHVLMKEMDGVTTAMSTPVFIKGERVRIDRAVDGAKELREERYPLDQQFHGSLIGVAGRTVAELERASGARVTFEQTPFPCMVAKGTPIQRRSAWQAAQQALAALGTESLNVARPLWSVVIGAGGANIRRIESESGARLQLEEDPEPHLKIQGMPQARKVAKALIRGILDREEEELYPVASKYHGLLVGKRGMTVKELQRDSGAFISFVKKPQPGMVAKGLMDQRDRAWGITQILIEELPIVLAEIRGVDKEAADAEIESTFGYSGYVAAQSSEDDDEAANPRADEVWEEAVARALERAKTKYKEAALEQRRRERGDRAGV